MTSSASPAGARSVLKHLPFPHLSFLFFSFFFSSTLFSLITSTSTQLYLLTSNTNKQHYQQP